jgi:predicted nucleic acid-binding protein
VSSALLSVEAIRACARYGVEYGREASAWLEGVTLLPMEGSVLGEAALLEPPAVRSLDAIHLSTALSVREDIGAFFTYDARLGEAATEHGLTVSTPGA